MARDNRLAKFLLGNKESDYVLINIAGTLIVRTPSVDKLEENIPIPDSRSRKNFIINLANAGVATSRVCLALDISRFPQLFSVKREEEKHE